MRTHEPRIRRPAVRAALSAYVERVSGLFPDDVAAIILYGSQARGDASGDSDIDVLVVLRRELPALRQALADIAWQVQFEHGVVISDVIRTVEQLERMPTRRFPFYQSVQRDGVVLWRSMSGPMPAFG
ncbi:MAG: Nucleotidyltransferase domain protein [Chloroflexi bacterium ADurb.Bin325]|nr:MAG: Nucleotidyltransferase domain protein [Chloroflexi bacterium ADurb.Bin325]